MSFYKTNSENITIRNRVQYQQSDDEKILVEQNHKDEVDINNIVKKHGMDLIAKTAAMQNFIYDDNPNNDFQETMNAIIQAEKSFSSIPSEIRKKFDNSPAQFMDFIHNSENQQQLVDWGLAQEPEIIKPIEVLVTNTVEDGAPAVENAP